MFDAFKLVRVGLGSLTPLLVLRQVGSSKHKLEEAGFTNVHVADGLVWLSFIPARVLIGYKPSVESAATHHARLLHEEREFEGIHSLAEAKERRLSLLQSTSALLHPLRPHDTHLPLRIACGAVLCSIYAVFIWATDAYWEDLQVKDVLCYAH